MIAAQASARLAPGPAGKLDALQTGRMVAALLVVLYHANNFIVPLRLLHDQIAWTGFGMGYAGVEFFFVLSGFIMVHVHSRDFDTPSRIGRYFRKRVTRIYPVYWIVLTGLVLLYQAMDTLGPEILRDPRAIVTSFLLLPSAERTILPVAWTLKHEVLFYLVFAAFLLRRRIGTAIFGVWGLACLGQILWPVPEFPASFLLSPYNLLFVMGMIVAQIFRRLPPATSPLLFWLGAAGFLTVGMSEQFLFAWPLAARTIAYGVSASAMITAMARSDIAVPRWSVFLGNASYAIYLVHLPAMNVCAVVLAKLGAPALLPPLFLVAVLSVLAVLSGVAMHVLIERPLMARLGQRRPAPVPPLWHPREKADEA